ncbi:MAG: metalloregulator ArsR/SmtB family transcription factor, partial [Acidobacteria bacterium]|nr:metalloregulator ArsR/SmtB family transcription factor [Acidobacteriota bacterium]
MDPSFNVTTVGGDPNWSGIRAGIGSSALFVGANGMAFAPDGRLLVADWANQMIYSGTPNLTPVASSVTPTSGTTVGGTPFTISGSDFLPGVKVTFGGLPAADVVRVNATTITGRTPMGIQGSATVAVSNPVACSTNVASGFGYQCVAATAPVLASPASGATSVSSSPQLSWNGDAGHFRYDLYLDTNPSPSTLVAANILPAPNGGTNTLRLSNLAAGTTYYWKIVAAGDPACAGTETASQIRSFTTAAVCNVPAAPALTAPAANATGVGSSTTLSWSPVSGTGLYDVFFGAVNPPPFSSSTSSTSVNISSLQSGTTYYWSVVARAQCDLTKSGASEVRTFTVSGSCQTPASVSLEEPADAAGSIPTSPRLQWSTSTNAAGYDLYFGTHNPPRLLVSNVMATGLSLSGLERGTTYYWRVVARSACDPSLNQTSAVRSFTTSSDCEAANAPAFVPDSPSSIEGGRTYVLTWSSTSVLGEPDSYVIERSLSSNFATLLDSRITRLPSATFTADAPSTIYHRVKIVRGCATPLSSAWSSSQAIQVIAEPHRRQILGLVWEDELAAGDIADRFEITFGAVSQHLSVLRRAGFVDVRPEGNRRLYRANKQ